MEHRPTSPRSRPADTGRPEGDGWPPTGQPKKSNKLCLRYQQGYCRYGSDCNYRHQGEPGTMHPAYKTKKCRDWPDGKCKFGSGCNFIHGDDEDDARHRSRDIGKAGQESGTQSTLERKGGDSPWRESFSCGRDLSPNDESQSWGWTKESERQGRLLSPCNRNARSPASVSGYTPDPWSASRRVDRKSPTPGHGYTPEPSYEPRDIKRQLPEPVSRYTPEACYEPRDIKRQSPEPVIRYTPELCYEPQDIKRQSPEPVSRYTPEACYEPRDIKRQSPEPVSRYTPEPCYAPREFAVDSYLPKRSPEAEPGSLPPERRHKRSKRRSRAKRTPCRNMLKTGHCRFGDRCFFSHDESLLEARGLERPSRSPSVGRRDSGIRKRRDSRELSPGPNRGGQRGCPSLANSHRNGEPEKKSLIRDDSRISDSARHPRPPGHQEVARDPRKRMAAENGLQVSADRHATFSRFLDHVEPSRDPRQALRHGPQQTSQGATPTSLSATRQNQEVGRDILLNSCPGNAIQDHPGGSVLSPVPRSSSSPSSSTARFGARPQPPKGSPRDPDSGYTCCGGGERLPKDKELQSGESSPKIPRGDESFPARGKSEPAPDSPSDALPTHDPQRRVYAEDDSLLSSMRMSSCSETTNYGAYPIRDPENELMATEAWRHRYYRLRHRWYQEAAMSSGYGVPGYFYHPYYYSGYGYYHSRAPFGYRNESLLEQKYREQRLRRQQDREPFSRSYHQQHHHPHHHCSQPSSSSCSSSPAESPGTDPEEAPPTPQSRHRFARALAETTFEMRRLEISKHPLYKTQRCMNHAFGPCAMGKFCFYIHGENDPERRDFGLPVSGWGSGFRAGAAKGDGEVVDLTFSCSPERDGSLSRRAGGEEEVLMESSRTGSGYSHSGDGGDGGGDSEATSFAHVMNGLARSDAMNTCRVDGSKPGAVPSPVTGPPNSTSLPPYASHPKYKTETCTTFDCTGTCVMGRDCFCIHGDEGEWLPGWGIKGSGETGGRKGV